MVPSQVTHNANTATVLKPAGLPVVTTRFQYVPVPIFQCRSCPANTYQVPGVWYATAALVLTAVYGMLLLHLYALWQEKKKIYVKIIMTVKIPVFSISGITFMSVWPESGRISTLDSQLPCIGQT